MQGKLDQEKLRRFYDRFGKKQDKQGFYEDAPLDALIRQSDFRSAQAVFEIGCGTGKFAARLLSHHLQDTARYIGVDISSTMVELARNRLKPWAQRVQIHQSDGSFDFGSYGGPFDRIVATYVFDLLSRRQIDDAFNGAHAVAKKGALLCIAGLTKGIGPFPRATSKLWELIYNVNPYIVGGCRPLLLEGIFHAHARDWRITHRAVVVSATVPSEVITAEAV
jgi:ubiquinone/menaquinone biosynthesis C-methylase UbiE